MKSFPRRNKKAPSPRRFIRPLFFWGGGEGSFKLAFCSFISTPDPTLICYWQVERAHLRRVRETIGVRREEKRARDRGRGVKTGGWVPVYGLALNVLG